MQQVEFTAEVNIDTLVDRIGALPDAPLAMPKQRIETPAAGRLAWLGWARIPAGAMRRTGQ